ncbi:uncharacterized protein Tes [Linepithema humile]|uniref:uncharacterized protein Tes n=1 Tax=Linepithema humile TaxID=83485 RepID=UPI0006231EAF|nr:PREDICTED: uncharacterized protein LOC105675451 [Linepithema humile]
MEDIVDRPKWLLELENRKRKPRLAHETGAGAPCVNCNSGCPGLDLHFWRKICKNCKCGRDDHDVDDDDFLQFDLLFGPSKKFRKKSMCLKINNRKHHEGETIFEWVPPDTTKELAMDYMKALPAEKLPIKGSTGAVLRRQLLQKQLPLHDINHKACDELSEQEQKQFEKYLESIKKYVGQGKVMKMLGARPFDRSLMTPINATDMQRSPQRKPHVPSTGVQLRTPSSFAAKSPSKHLYKTPNKQDIGAVNDNEVYTAEEYKCPVDNVSANIAKSQPIEKKFCENIEPAGDAASKRGINSKVVNFSIPACLAEQEIVSARETHTSGNYVPYERSATERHGETLNDIAPCFVHSTTIDSEAASIAESMLADAFLPPSAIHANDIIGSTLDEEKLSFIRNKLADKYNAAENPVLHAALQSSRPLDASDTLPFKGRIKNNHTSSNKDPERREVVKNLTKTSAEKSPLESERKTHKQPSQVVESTIANINDEKQCSWLSKHKGTSDSSATEAPNVATNSSKSNCTNPAVSHSSDSQSSVNASPLQAALNNAVLRPTVIHSEQLQNQVFPHVVENFNEQRNTQHAEYLKDAMEALRVDSTKPHNCEKCHEDIRVGDVAITAEKANNAFWHPGCFVCSVCDELLVDLVYFYYKNQLYCGRDLAAFLEIPRCFACDELIFVREYTVAEGHNYHVKHFCCWDCDVPLAGQQYITENDRPLCLSCYQKSYAKTCVACNTVIAADQQGVAIKDLNFHATEACFCCYSCKKNLLNGKMAIKKDKLFCSKECISKFLNQ